jgi:hypothetical protein
VSFAMQKLFNLMHSHLSILTLISWAIGVLFRKSLLCLHFAVFFLFPVFYSTCLQVSSLTLKSLIYFELFCVYSER